MLLEIPEELVGYLRRSKRDKTKAQERPRCPRKNKALKIQKNFACEVNAYLYANPENIACSSTFVSFGRYLP